MQKPLPERSSLLKKNFEKPWISTNDEMANK